MNDEGLIVEGSEKPKGKLRFTKKQWILIAAAGALLLAAIGGGLAWYLNRGDSMVEEEISDPEGGDKPNELGLGGKGRAYLDVPPMIVNLRTSDGVARFMKVHVAIVPANGVPVERLRQKLPLVLDAYQPFMRELRPEDLNGAAAVYRVKEEMLVRATQTLGPNQVKDVLILDLVQQ